MPEMVSVSFFGDKWCLSAYDRHELSVCLVREIETTTYQELLELLLKEGNNIFNIYGNCFLWKE